MHLVSFKNNKGVAKHFLENGMMGQIELKLYTD
jgi:hypothetical protein